MSGDELLITIYGLRTNGDDNNVDAELFQKKLSNILKAAKETDKAINEKRSARFMISSLRKGSAEVGLVEMPLTKIAQEFSSPLQGLVSCITKLYRGHFADLWRFSRAIESIHTFSKGAGREFSHIEVGFRDKEPIPVDKFFETQVEQFMAAAHDQVKRRHFFMGESIDSFDSILKEVDFRGRQVRGFLHLSGTTVQIECVFAQSVGEENIRKSVNKRVWAIGVGRYDGETALPARIEIRQLKSIDGASEPRRWIGALKPFDLDKWEGDGENIN